MGFPPHNITLRIRLDSEYAFATAIAGIKPDLNTAS